jgi:hypothetical protein
VRRLFDGGLRGDDGGADLPAQFADRLGKVQATINSSSTVSSLGRREAGPSSPVGATECSTIRPPSPAAIACNG